MADTISFAIPRKYAVDSSRPSDDERQLRRDLIYLSRGNRPRVTFHEVRDTDFPLALEEISDLEALSSLTIMEPTKDVGTVIKSGKVSSRNKSKVFPGRGEDLSHGSWNGPSYLVEIDDRSNEEFDLLNDLREHYWSERSLEREDIESPLPNGHQRSEQSRAVVRREAVFMSHLGEAEPSNAFDTVVGYESSPRGGNVEGFTNPQQIWHASPTAYQRSLYHDRATAMPFPMPVVPHQDRIPLQAPIHGFDSFGGEWHETPLHCNDGAVQLHVNMSTPYFHSNEDSLTPDSGQTALQEKYALDSRSDHSNGSLASKKHQSLGKASEQDVVSDISSAASDNEREGGVSSDTAPLSHDPCYANPKPGLDGKFHCPFENEQDCGHAPTRHRCYYEKYVDSHLKPYRCKAHECKELRFSSSACRVRHEREAHGSHGHGVKPFLCEYSDCERSKEGHGFPRLWNRNDHMKRVHDHSQICSELEKDKEEATEETNARKRHSSGLPNGERTKRVKFFQKEHKENKLAQMARDWVVLHTQVHEHWHNIRGPLDLENVEKLHSDSLLLLNSANEIRRSMNQITAVADPAVPKTPRI